MRVVWHLVSVTEDAGEEEAHLRRPCVRTRCQDPLSGAKVRSLMPGPDVCSQGPPHLPMQNLLKISPSRSSAVKAY